MGGGTANLPPGFRFFPSDEELIVHFLYRKAAVLHCEPGVIPSIDLHECKALQGGDRFWCFFTRRKQNRADKIIICSNKDAAMKKTLRYYYIGQPPEGIKTNRVMHRYHLLDGILGSSPSGGSSSSTSTRGKRRRAVCTYYYHQLTGELSWLEEVFLSLDDLDEVCLPN
ncbi:NAC domain-containing protein 104-like [Musa acuminata AAA Group]